VRLSGNGVRSYLVTMQDAGDLSSIAARWSWDLDGGRGAAPLAHMRVPIPCLSHVTLMQGDGTGTEPGANDRLRPRGRDLSQSPGFDTFVRQYGVRNQSRYQ